MKKILSMLLCLVLSFSTIPVLAEASVKSVSLRKPIGPFYNEVVINDIYDETGNEIRVSRYIIGPGTVTVTLSESVSASYSISLDYGVEAKLFDLASAKVGGSIGRSFSIGVSYSEAHGFTIPSGMKGAVYFAPYFKVIRATYFDENGYSTEVIAKYPINRGGYADGEFYVKYR